MNSEIDATEVFSVKLNSIEEDSVAGNTDLGASGTGTQTTDAENGSAGGGGGGCNYNSQMPLNDQAGNLILMAAFSLVIFIRRKKIILTY